MLLWSTQLFIWTPGITEKAAYPAVLMGPTVHLLYNREGLDETSCAHTFTCKAWYVHPPAGFS